MTRSASTWPFVRWHRWADVASDGATAYSLRTGGSTVDGAVSTLSLVIQRSARNDVEVNQRERLMVVVTAAHLDQVRSLDNVVIVLGDDEETVLAVPIDVSAGQTDPALCARRSRSAGAVSLGRRRGRRSVVQHRRRAATRRRRELGPPSTLTREPDPAADRSGRSPWSVCSGRVQTRWMSA